MLYRIVGFCILLAAFAPSYVSAQKTGTEDFDLGSCGSILQLTYPSEAAEWRVVVDNRYPNDTRIQFLPIQRNGFEITVSIGIIYVPLRQPSPSCTPLQLSIGELKEILERKAKAVAAGRPVEIKEISGGPNRGFSYTIADPPPTAKCNCNRLMGSLFNVGTMTISMTVSTNPGFESIEDVAVKMMQSATEKAR